MTQGTQGVVLPIDVVVGTTTYKQNGTYDFSHLRENDIPFIAVIISEGFDKVQPHLDLIAEEADKQNVMLIVIFDVPLGLYFNKYSDPGGWKSREYSSAFRNDDLWELWGKLVANKKIYACLMWVRDREMPNGINVTCTNVNTMLDRTLYMWREYGDKINPGYLKDNRIILMIGKELVQECGLLSTRLSKEKGIAVEDFKFSDYWMLPSGKRLEELWQSLPKIGLDGDDNEDVDELHSQGYDFDVWAKPYFQTKCYGLETGDGLVGAIRFKGTQEQLFEKFGFEDTYVPPEDPTDPPEDPTDPPEETKKEKITRLWKELFAIIGELFRTYFGK